MSSPTTAALKRKHASPARRSFEVAASASDKSDTFEGKKYIPGGPIANALVVVTGANRGIGLEFCKQILAKSDGNSVVASCRDPSAATDLNALQKEMGASRLAIVALDVADEKSIAKWAESLAALEPVKAHGGSISVVINNAGTTGTDGYSKWELQDMTAEEMMHVYRINTIGPMLVTQQLVKRGLVGSSAGSPPEGPVSLVGNVTSKVGSVDDNGSGKGYAYRASKAALNIVNKSMSIDLADRGVWCQLLHPGWVRTRMTEGRGLIDADESAAGLIKAMEGEYGPINGCWYDYKGDEIPW
jgi:NAD(P)-dependent dehydrogenase (short-subunit alcohol dehydrogenase family)